MLPKDIFQKHSHIGLDLDDTLADSMLDILDKLHLLGQVQSLQDIEQIDSFELDTLPGCTWTQQQMHAFFRRQQLTDVTPLEGSSVGIGELLKKQYNISVITARNEIDHQIDTVQWLNTHFPEIDPSQIHFANHSSHNKKNKSDLCKKLNITLMIDDGLHNAVDLAENGITCILMDKPWNRKDEATHPLIYRVKNWQEIINNLSSN